jgi:hypothetical protein
MSYPGSLIIQGNLTYCSGGTAIEARYSLPLIIVL